MSYFQKISKPKPTKIKFSLSDLDYLNFSFQIAFPIFFGLTLGLFLDNLFNTRPYLFLVFLVLGVIASFYNIFKLIKVKKS